MGRKKYASHYSIKRKKRERHNGFLVIDTQEVKSHLQTTKVAKAEQVAAFLLSIIFYYLAQGSTKFTFWLDNARTHKKKMKTILAEHLKDFGIQERVEVKFIHIPPYSPKMNAAEYFIQIIRKQYLKNLPPDQSIEQVLERLLPKVNEQQLMKPEQMQNLLRRIKVNSN